MGIPRLFARRCKRDATPTADRASHHFSAHPTTRALIAIGYIAAAALVAVSMTANVLFALSLGSHPAEQSLFVTASLAVDAWKAGGLLFVGLLAANRKRSMAVVGFLFWAACLCWSSASAIGFAAMTRGEVVAERSNEADTRAAAQAKVHRVEAQLAAIVSHRPPSVIEAAIRTEAGRDPLLWRRTKECSEVTKPASAEWCGPILALRAELANANEAAKLETELAGAREQLAKAGGATGDAVVVDPQAVALGTLAGIAAGDVRLILGLLLAGLIEAGSALGLAIVGAASGTIRNTARQEEPASVPHATAVQDEDSRKLAEAQRPGPQCQAFQAGDAAASPSLRHAESIAGDGQGSGIKGKLGKALLEHLKANGGKVRSGQRRLARGLGASTTELHRTLHGLASAGLVIVVADKLGTTLTLPTG